MAIKRYTGDKFSALSTDTKPTNILAGATLFETDTSKVFVYDGSAWNEVGYSVSGHTHPASDITSGTFADARIAQSNVTQHESALTITESQIADLGNYALASHTHAVNELSDVYNATPADGDVLIYDGVTDNRYENRALVEADISDLGNYAVVGHAHAAGDITSGTFADARIAQTSVTQHEAALTITESQISDFGTYQPTSEKGVAGGYASLDANAKIPTTQLPALAITETDVVADIAARDALVVEEGDIAIVNDASADTSVDSGSATYIWDGAGWQRLKQPTDTVESVNGQTGVVTLNTDDISEGTTNLYWTQTRFDTAFGNKSTSDLSEGTNLYYTDERVDDRVNALLVAGSNISLTYDDVGNSLTIANTYSAPVNSVFGRTGAVTAQSGDYNTDQVTEGTSNLYFTNERVDDRVNNLLVGGTNVTLTYDDVNNSLTIDATSGSSIAGTDHDIQYNNAGTPAGDGNFEWIDGNSIHRTAGYQRVEESAAAIPTPANNQTDKYITTETVGTDLVIRVLQKLGNGDEVIQASYVAPGAG